MEQEVKTTLDGSANNTNDIWKAVGNNAAELLAARISISILLALNPQAIEQLEKSARRVIDGIDHPNVRENLRRIFTEQYGINIYPINTYTLHLPN